VASAYVSPVTTQGGSRRYRVFFRTHWRKPATYAGSFRTKREAKARRDYCATELAAMRTPDVKALLKVQKAPTLREAADRWRESRHDVTEGTRTLHRVALDRVLPALGEKRVDQITDEDVAGVVAKLVDAGKKRETIKKSVTYLAAVLDDAGAEPNPAKSKKVRLPHEDREEPEPPSADHVEAVYRLLPRAYRPAFLWLDWSGARLASVELTKVGDYDAPAGRVRQRAASTKNRKAVWTELHPALAEAIEAGLPPREDRDPETPLFAGVTDARLRMAIIRACKAAGVPTFTPHDLRHRRVSLLHRQGMPWAEIGRLVGQKKLSVTADTYTHVLVDGREADYEALLAA
jgi:integrase